MSTVYASIGCNLAGAGASHGYGDDGDDGPEPDLDWYVDDTHWSTRPAKVGAKVDADKIVDAATAAAELLGGQAIQGKPDAEGRIFIELRIPAEDVNGRPTSPAEIRDAINTELGSVGLDFTGVWPGGGAMVTRIDARKGEIASWSIPLWVVRDDERVTRARETVTSETRERRRPEQVAAEREERERAEMRAREIEEARQRIADRAAAQRATKAEEQAAALAREVEELRAQLEAAGIKPKAKRTPPPKPAPKPKAKPLTAKEKKRIEENERRLKPKPAAKKPTKKTTAKAPPRPVAKPTKPSKAQKRDAAGRFAKATPKPAAKPTRKAPAKPTRKTASKAPPRPVAKPTKTKPTRSATAKKKHEKAPKRSAKR